MEAVPRTNTGELPVLKEVLEFLFPHIGTFWQVNIPIIQCIVIKTLQTSLKITAAVDSATPNKSSTVLHDEPWANLYKQIAGCFSGITGSGFMRVGCFSRRCVTSWTRKSNVSLFTLKRFLKAKSFQFRYPDAHQEPSRDSFWPLSFLSFELNKTPHRVKDLCFFHLFVHLTQKKTDSRFSVALLPITGAVLYAV